MGARSWVGLCCVSLIAASCGVLPGTNSGSDDAVGEAPTAIPPPLPTPVVAPTPLPTATTRPTATPLPTPSPTPNVIDSYTTMLFSVRALFESSTLEEDIADLVPLPFAIPIPADARLERVDLAYGRWDIWEQITDEFPPVDTAADVVISAGFLTDQEVDSLREEFSVAPLEAGYVVSSDDSQPGSFSDVVYQLNGGVLSRGRDGEYRVSIFRQGDETFVEFRVRAELEADPDPPLASWPDLFVIPFSGDFTNLGVVAIKSTDGIEVVSEAQWILGARGSSQEAAMATLVAEYPSSAISIKDTISTGSNAGVVATITHSTGSSGSISLDFTQEFTVIDILLLALPG